MRSRFTPFAPAGFLMLAAFCCASCGPRRAETPSGSAPVAATTSPPAATSAADLATLTVRVVDLRNHKGNLVFGVFRQAGGFPSDQSKSVAWEVRPVGDDVEVFTAHLPPGRYGASVLHDENANGKMDTNLVGIPKEGYGVTNNPKPKFRAARFDESTFDLPAGGATETISVQYF